MALQFAKLPLRTKIIGLAGAIIVVAGISALGYQAYKSRPSAETQGSPCKFTYQITKADNRFAVYVTDKKTYDTIKANPKSTGSMTRIATLVGNGEMTVSVDPDLEMYAIGFKDDGTFLSSESFTCRKSNAYLIVGNLNNPGSITATATGTPITTGSGVAVGTKKCIQDPQDNSKYLYVTKLSDDLWVRPDTDDITYNDAQVQQYSNGGMYESLCQSQQAAGNTGAGTTASNNKKVCAKNVSGVGEPYQWVGESLLGADFVAEPDTSKCGAQTTTASVPNTVPTGGSQKCVLMGSTYILVKKNGDAWCNAKDCTATYPDKYISNLTVDSTGVKCGVTGSPVPSQNAQPAAKSAYDNILKVYGTGSGAKNDPTLPYGNSTITFQVARYSRAANEGQEYMTAVGGVKFTLTGRIAKTTVGQGNKSGVAFAQVNGSVTAPGEGRIIGEIEGGRPSIVPIEEGPSVVTGAATQKTQTDISKALGSGIGTTQELDVKYTNEQARAYSKISKYVKNMLDMSTKGVTVRGIVPDNGTKSMILVTGLAAGSYNLTLSKSGYETQSNISFEIGNGDYTLPRLHIKPSPGAEPPSIDNITVTKDSRKIEPYNNLYYAGSSYIYKSDCPDAGWLTPEMVNECPHIEYPGGEPMIVGNSGDPYYSPTLANLMGYFGQYCMDPQASVFVNASDHESKSSILEGFGGGVLGGLLASVSNGKDLGDIKFAKEILVPGAVGALTAALGADLNFNVGQSLCPNYQMPYYPTTNNPYSYTTNPYNQTAWGAYLQGEHMVDRLRASFSR